MGVLQNIIYEIEKHGGIAKYYQAISFEVYKSETKPSYKGKKAIVDYPFSEQYIIEMYKIKSVYTMAKDLGTNKDSILRKLRNLGIKKPRVYPKHQAEIRETCILVNLETGCFYVNCSEAAYSINKSENTVQHYIRKRGFYKSFKVA